jgi:hypothetical protein
VLLYLQKQKVSIVLPQGIYSVTSQLFLDFYKRRNPHSKKLVLQPVTEEFVLLMPIKALV